MMGEPRIDQAALFYQFSLERHVPADHMLRAIDQIVDLVRAVRQLRLSTARAPKPLKKALDWTRKDMMRATSSPTRSGFC